MTRSINRIVPAFVLAMLIVSSVHAALPKEDVISVPAVGDGLCVHNLFQTNMVLQRDKPIRVWGWATPDEKVTVRFAGEEATATAGDDRVWSVTLPAIPASAEPRAMTVTGKADTLTLENILVGDVWVLGGQSNMEFPIASVENGELEIASANLPNLRILTVPYGNGAEPVHAFARLDEYSSWFSRHFRKGDWDLCTPETVRDLSAIGYVFVRRLQMASQVPIGVIDASRGGTTVETWTPMATLRKLDAPTVKSMLTEWDEKVAAWDPKADLEARIKKHHEWVERMKKDGKPIPADRTVPAELEPGPIGNPNYPGACYNGMIAPIAGLSVKGVIFHQGYNNCFNGTPGADMYRRVFPEMIAAWRSAFNDPELPFGILSLCTQGKLQTRDDFTEQMHDAGPYVREAQHQTYLELLNAGDKNVGFVSTFDLGRRWYHPQLKVPAGERIARWALATQYGMDRRIQWQPAQVQSVTAADGRVVVKFDRPVAAVDNGTPIQGFAIAGEDRNFHPADADYLVTGKDDRGRDQFDKTTIVLTSAMVPEPAAYRYAWARMPMANLLTGDGRSDIPVPTLRSDDWPMEAIPLGVLEGDGASDKPSRADRAKILQALRAEDLRRRLFEAEQLIEQHGPKSADRR